MANESIKPGAAFLADEAANPTPVFDRLDASGRLSAAEIRQVLGDTITPEVAQLDTVAPEPSERETARAEDSDYYAQEFRLTGDWTQHDPDQQSTNARGLATARQALLDARKRRTTSSNQS